MLRLRQIALVAHDLDAAEADLSAVFGLAVCHRDPGVGRFGLHNFLMPVGNSFLEVVAPTEDNTAAGRYLDRRDGDGGYMVIMQTDDVPAARERMTSLGVRLITDGGNERTDGIQLHPADVPGAIAELRWNHRDQDPAGPWHPAGHDWIRAQRLDVIRAFRAAELQSDDPPALAARWSEVLARPVATDPAGRPTIVLDDATLRFVPITDGRPEGLAALDVEVVDRDRLLNAARERGCPIEGDTVTVCGTRFHLV